MNIPITTTPDRQAALTDLLTKHNKKAVPALTEPEFIAFFVHAALDAHADSLVESTLQEIRTRLRAKASRLASATTLLTKV